MKKTTRKNKTIRKKKTTRNKKTGKKHIRNDSGKSSGNDSGNDSGKKTGKKSRKKTSKKTGDCLKKLIRSWKPVIFCFLIVAIPVIVYGVHHYQGSYGFLQKARIDDADRERWEHEDGFIKGVKGFTIKDEKDHCWILLHGYTSTPKEMEELAELLHDEFNDTIYVPMLEGHGQLPSLMLNKSAEDWYRQVKKEYQKADERCGKVNIVGSSFGGMLALRLASEKELGNIYVLSPLLYINSHVVPKELQISILGNMLNYMKKVEVGAINDPCGLKKHVAYWVLPIKPLKESLPFIRETRDELEKVTEPILIMQSRNDTSVSPKSAETVEERVSSTDKRLIWYEKSDHVLLMDYDRYRVMKAILDFEKERR